MTDPTFRRYAFVRDGYARRVGHFVGLPPQLTEGRDTRTRLPDARLVVLEQRADGTYLFRFSPDATYAGDTWHANLDDALHQATFEFGDAIEGWTDAFETLSESTLEFAARVSKQRGQSQ